VTLAERSGGVLNPAVRIKFRMARGDAAPLAELLELLDGIFAGEGKYRIEHGRHMARIEEEAVAGNPGGIVGVGYEILGIKHVDKVGATHGATGMTRFGFLDH